MVLSGDAGSSDADFCGEEEVGPSTEVLLSSVSCPMEDFPLEQSCDDTLRSAFDQVVDIDGHVVCPEAVWTYLRFVSWKDRLYRVSCETHPVVGVTKPPRNYFPGGSLYTMAEHTGYDKTLE